MMTSLMPDERMLTATTTAIDALAAPRRDGELLIEPDVARLIGDARANRILRAGYDFRLLDRPARDWLAPRTNDDRPLVIMSGHQPEFFHPGVWIKHVLASRLAQRLDGEAHFLVVDSDVPVIVRLEWPVVNGGFAEVDGARAAAIMDWRSYEYIRDRKGIDYSALFDAARKRFAGHAESPLDAFADAMTALQSDSGYTQRWIGALTACDASLDVPPVTHTCISDAFGFSGSDCDEAAAALVAHIIINAHEFRLAYNKALNDYRSRRNIAGTQHPIPDLAETDRRIECPFWLNSPTHGRERLYATPCKHSECATLFAGDKPLGDFQLADLIASPAEALARTLGDWGVRPRALAQTLYARIFACDLFLHGIGGAKYDQITDDVIRNFLNVEPPAYGAVSATLRLPVPTFDATPDDLANARTLLRDLHYNPQRHADAAQLADMRAELAERQAAIEESDRLRRVDPDNRPKRKAAFDRIHAANDRIRSQLPELANATKDQITQLTRELDHNRIAENREWFYALYSAAQLRALRDKAWQIVDDA